MTLIVVTAGGGGGGGGAVTVSETVAFTPFALAVICVDPPARPVATPYSLAFRVDRRSLTPHWYSNWTM